VSGYLLILLAACLWGLIGVFSKSVLDSGIGALEIAFWRACLAGILFLAHARFRRSVKLHKRSDAGAFIGFSVLGVAVFYASLVLAIDTGGISLAFILLYSAPAFVALFAWLLLGETITRRKLLLISLALLGVVLVSQDRGTGVAVSFASLFWGLTAGISYASYYIFGKWVLKRYQPVTVYAFVLPLGALLLLPLVDFQHKTLPVWGLFLLLAFLSTYLAYLAYFTGLKRVQATRAVLVATVEPVVAAALAALLFGEFFSTAGYIGSALILGAAIVTALPKSLRRTTS
jgi:DME family drug/metabolite transporter